jgi:hypothetical protein
MCVSAETKTMAHFLKHGSLCINHSVNMKREKSVVSVQSLGVNCVDTVDSSLLENKSPLRQRAPLFLLDQVRIFFQTG